jgi:hypothetical protein
VNGVVLDRPLVGENEGNRLELAVAVAATFRTPVISTTCGRNKGQKDREQPHQHVHVGFADTPTGT